MASIFTEHVRQFSGDSDPAERVLPELKRLLKLRMRRKNLLSAPPSYLGYQGFPSWNSAEAYEDIVVDCYVYAVLNRLQGLRNQLPVRDNIDGLIIRNVDNFLLERQRRHDPIGYAVFGNVEGAARTAVTTGELRIDGAAEGRLHGSSLLRLDALGLSGEAVDRDRVREALAEARDSSAALPNLTSVTEEGQEWIIAFLKRLKESGVAAVACGDLVTVLATQARADWASRHGVSEGELAHEGGDEFGALVRMVWPDQGFEDRERWEELKRRIPERIAGLDRQQRVRERLAVVFGALVQVIEEGGPSPPTQAELIERLGIARATLSDDFHSLREIIRELVAENPEG